MSASRYILILACLACGCLACGCSASQQPTPDRSGNRMYAFDHEGLSYEIYSIDAPTAAPVNFLLRREEGRVVLRAKDVDQDGTIDTVLTGGLSLGVANAIYQAGIAQAQASGQYAERQPTEVYRTEADSGYYAVQTYVLAPERSYNAFVIYDAARQDTSILLDIDADGVLDTVQRGAADPAAAQEAYEAVLRQGEEEGRVRRIGSRVVVQPGPA